MSDNTNNNAKIETVNTFFDEDSNSGFKFKDLVFLILHNLHWFLIGALICGTVAYFRVRSQEKIYSSHASILIKTAASGGSDTYRGSAVMMSHAGGSMEA